MLNEYEQEKKLLVDITTPARSIEVLIGHLLLPTPRGFYLPSSREPIISEDKVYFQYVEASDEMKRFHGADLIHDRSLITGDVYSENRSLLLKHQALPLVSDVPSLPIRSIGIILDLINNHLVQHFAYNSKDIDYAEHAIDGRVREEFNDPAILVDITNAIYDIHSPTRMLITSFMGDDHHKRHLVRMIGESALILKQSDYRIIRFNELLEAGEIDAPKKVWDHTY